MKAKRFVQMTVEFWLDEFQRTGQNIINELNNKRTKREKMIIMFELSERWWLISIMMQMVFYGFSVQRIYVSNKFTMF